jgi:hypothetical protein
MQVSIDDFWKLALASGALAREQCESLRAEFAGLKGAARAGTGSLVEWLVSTGALTPYQAKVLAAGRPGPFAFGPFVVRDRIEKGRLTRLHRATFEGGQSVLLVFLSQLTDDTRDYDALVELARSAAKVKNPHVTRTYRAAQHASHVFIVVEDLAGRSLAEILPHQRLKTRKACQFGLQLSLGLIALGGERLVHGALCPHNVWIDASGSLRLMQFPLVASPGRQNRLEMPLVDYVAPELTEPDATATPESDVYSLGCTLYEMIAGRVPFPGGTAQQKIARHRTELPQRLDALDPQVPAELADLVDEMLAKDPLLRCGSASQVAHLLAPYVTKAKGIASRPPSTGQPRPGFGAWQAPEWKAPPPQAIAPVKAPVAPAPVTPAPPAAVQPATPAVKQPAPARRPKAPAIEPAADEITLDVGRVVPAEVGAAPQDSPEAIVIHTEQAPLGAGAADAENEFAIVVTDSETTLAAAGTRKRMSRVTLARIVAAIASIITLAITGAYLVYRDRVIRAPDPPKVAAKTAPALDPRDDPDWQANVERIKAGLRGESEPAADNLVDDDGQTLWASPTSGPPLETAFLPNGTQLILALRPAELLSGPEGARLLAALGPSGAWSEAHLRQTLGIDPKLIEQLTIAVAPDDALAPQTSYVMRLAQDVPEKTLFDAWGQPGTALHASKRYYQGDTLAYYRPESGGGRVVVVAPKQLMQQMLEFEGQPLVRASLEALLARSDSDRQVNLLFTTSYLLTDGRELLAGHLHQLHAPLRSFLADDVDAALVSADVGDALYVELRAVAPAHVKPLELKDRLRARWAQVPAQVEAIFAGLNPQPYGKLVLLRFPRMLQTAVEYTRSGVDNGQAVLNAYLPASAAHNLVLGTELTLLETSGLSTAPTPAAASSPRSAAAALAAPVSLSFPRESLDRAMSTLSQEIGVPIVIQGGDLQLDGITKNQSLNNVDERNQPAGDILRKLLKLANPDGKLVYVIKPDERGAETIWITTRAAATKRGDALPAGL